MSEWRLRTMQAKESWTRCSYSEVGFRDANEECVYTSGRDWTSKVATALAMSSARDSLIFRKSRVWYESRFTGCWDMAVKSEVADESNSKGLHVIRDSGAMVSAMLMPIGEGQVQSYTVDNDCEVEYRQHIAVWGFSSYRSNIVDLWDGKKNRPQYWVPRDTHVAGCIDETWPAQIHCVRPDWMNLNASL